MANLRPIRVEVLGIHQQFPSLLVVEIQLDKVPSSGWARLFHLAADATATGRQPEPGADPTFAPLLDRDTVLVTPRDGELDAALAHVKELITLTNLRHAQLQTDPRLTFDALIGVSVPVADFSDEQAERVQQARRKLETLSDLYPVPPPGTEGNRS